MTTETATVIKISVKTHLLNPDNKLPLVAEPASPATADVETLLAWIKEHKAEVEKMMVEHGAILFRNFKLKDAWDFEKIAMAIDPNLKNNYLGTSPRDLKTDYAFSASELPSYYPITQHIEMSYLKNHPKKLFFYCAVAPESGGETPVCDFRKVYEQLDPKIREEFIQKGIKNIRNYDGPKTKKKFDLWKLKRWDAMFLTEDKKEVEKKCKEQGLQYQWKDDDRLMLVDEHAATKKHPVTGEGVWFNHLQVFHADSAIIEYKKIAERQKTLRSTFFKFVIPVLGKMKNRGVATDDMSLHCVFGDGSPIPTEYVQHVEDVIWNNLVFFQWQEGDVIAIDNYSTSHGRMPYTGPREILVCWSE